MSIIEELWYGNIVPCEGEFKKDGAYPELLEYIVRHQEDLHKCLNDEEKEILKKLIDCIHELSCITEREVFAKGFTLGAKIIIEVLNTEIG